MLPAAIYNIQNKLHTIDKHLYIVGGYCREQILQHPSSTDIDLVTDATPQQMKTVLKVVGEIGKKYGTCIISESGQSFEITTMRKDIGSVNHRKPATVQFTNSLTQDALRRDFSCNAIYYDPNKEQYIDPQNGIQDIQNSILRFVGDPQTRIQEDALRILRCIRLKNKYQLHFPQDSYRDILRQYTPVLKNISIERIRQELDTILLHPSNIDALEDLKRIGFLELFLPELSKLSDCPGNKYHQEGNVWIHTKMCLAQMNHIISSQHITQKDRQLILLRAILLHDIGKYPSLSIDEDGQAHYYQHEHIGADMFAHTLAPRLQFSKIQRKSINFLIKEHLNIFKIPAMRKLKARKLMMAKYFPELLRVGQADDLGRIPAKPEVFQNILKIYEQFQDILASKTFFTGHEIMKKYPELKGREIGERLRLRNDQILASD